MPIAAVPNYLGKDFREASPGLRFGMFLPLWGVNRRTGEVLWSKSDIDHEVRGQQRQEREVKKENKVDALTQASKLTPRDKSVMKALAARQAEGAKTCSHLLTFDATATAPFTTGLGNEHPLENGFAFLNPYGLPYLPGSGIKGVLRQAARELASGEWGDAQGWSEESILALFGNDPATEPQLRGALNFWDVIPQIKGDSLAVDVMTPHQGHYYQSKVDPKTGDSANPHDSGQPIPINFLTVPPGSDFRFHVQCDLARLRHHAQDLAENARWQALLTAALHHAFEWLGFGAKTAVGYGAMETREQRAQQKKRAAEQHQRDMEKLAADTQARAEASAEPWPNARVKFNRANGSLSVEKGGKTAVALAPKGQELIDKLPAAIRQKIVTNQFVKVTAHVSGDILVRVEAA